MSLCHGSLVYTCTNHRSSSTCMPVSSSRFCLFSRTCCEAELDFFDDCLTCTFMPQMRDSMQWTAALYHASSAAVLGFVRVEELDTHGVHDFACT